MSRYIFQLVTTHRMHKAVTKAETKTSKTVILNINNGDFKHLRLLCKRLMRRGTYINQLKDLKDFKNAVVERLKVTRNLLVDNNTTWCTKHTRLIKAMLCNFLRRNNSSDLCYKSLIKATFISPLHSL